jgi:restriction endonuclease S subunit
MTRLVRLQEVASVRQGLGMSGRAAGSRSGSWLVKVVSIGAIQDDWLSFEQVQSIALERSSRTERHLLEPDDVLVTARSTVFKVALVPPSATRTLADSSLLVVRPALHGLGPYLWWYLTSTSGRQQAEARMVGSTVLALTASALEDLELPLPEQEALYRIAELVEASEQAYRAAIEAARLRRGLVRDAVIARLSQEAEQEEERTWR